MPLVRSIEVVTRRKVAGSRGTERGEARVATDDYRLAVSCRRRRTKAVATETRKYNHSGAKQFATPDLRRGCQLQLGARPLASPPGGTHLSVSTELVEERRRALVALVPSRSPAL